MPGTVKRMLDTIVEQRAKGNTLIMTTTRTKLVLKGVDPAQFTDSTPDDPAIIAKVRQIAAEMNISI